MARIPANAPRVDIDRAAGEVTISGTFAWRNYQDGLGLARNRSRYEIELPLADTPFARGFDAPASGGSDRIPGRARIEIDDPKFGTGRDVGARLQLGGYSGTDALSPDIPRRGVLFSDWVGTFNVGPLDGDQAYQVSIGFDADFSAITEVVAFMRVRQPVVGTDTFTEEIYRGVDTIAGKLELSALPGGPPAGGGGGGGGGPRPTGGADRLFGDGGVDRIAGRGGNDRIDGRGGNDRLDGGAGNDVLKGAGGDDRLGGGKGRDRLDGGGGDDTLKGGGGADRLNGGAGKDRLEDGDGADVLRGGAKADVFRLARDGDRDRIEDFEPGRDRINLAEFGRGLDFEDLAIFNRGAGVAIRVRGEALEVEAARGRLAPNDLDAGDFFFA
ncbi:MAG: hypothetical protein AAFU61_12185 [Pseudomonadota bacterium]